MDYEVWVRRSQIGYGVEEEYRKQGGWVCVTKHLFLLEALADIQRCLDRKLFVKGRFRLSSGKWDIKIYDPAKDKAIA